MYRTLYVILELVITLYFWDHSIFVFLKSINYLEIDAIFVPLSMEDQVLPLLQMDTNSSNNQCKENYKTMISVLQREEKIIKKLEKVCKELKETPENNTSEMLQRFDALYKTLNSLMKQEKEMKKRIEANDNFTLEKSSICHGLLYKKISF